MAEQGEERKNKKRGLCSVVKKHVKKKAKVRHTKKSVFFGFECPHCPQALAGDTPEQRHDKFLQRLCLCKKATYESTRKGHSL